MAKHGAAPKRSKQTATPPPPKSRRVSSPPGWLRPSRLLAIALVLCGLGWAASRVWNQAAPHIAASQRFRLSAQHVTCTATPEWLLADVRGDVLNNAGVDNRLSLLDDSFASVLHDAFAIHPWVASVDRITKSYPPAVHVDLTYRRPVAVVEVPSRDGLSLLPVDRAGVHLPAEDLPELKLRYLPRLSNVTGRPPVGQTWDDPRVRGGVELAIGLGEVWESLHLVEIVPSARPEIRGELRFFVYEIVTRGGTRIVWGASPEEAIPGEASFEDKLQRLQDCIAQVGPLDTVRSPKAVDVRQQLQIIPRTVSRPPVPGKNDPTLVK